ncbi:MAG: 4Fe-4S dicluster domain-containing protein [Longimicrobiales bacterium]|nr:4Fe-4S dicluster domain-containing protein [Longimicrobiales bacterium]
MSPAPSPPPPVQWAKVIDHARCIGCHACTTACKSENQVPVGVTRTYVKSVDVGVFPTARRAFQVTRCNQCADAPCVAACPTAAMHRRPDGIVDFDKSICIGCKACMAACPYDAIFINPEDHSAEKCNLCAHRLDVGLEPACVVVCPTEAIAVGDLNDPLARVTGYVDRDAVTVRRPEKGTHPRLFYKGAHAATLDPLAAERPAGGLFMWSEQGAGGPGAVPAGRPPAGASSAAALLSYDVPHRVPWDHRVSLYTWTKSIAAGAFLVPVLMAALGVLGPAGWAHPLVGGIGPALALCFLVLTAAILVWDLEHPRRFLLVLLRPQPRSWLVRGGFILTGYGALLALLLGVRLAGGAAGAGVGPGATVAAPGAATVATAVLAGLTAVYTAFLFAQARARDLWQSPLLPPHLLVQAVLAGAGALLIVARFLAPGTVPPLARVFAAASALHLLLILGETTLTHVTAHARQAVHEMVRGRLAFHFRAGVLLGLAGCAAVLPGLAVPAAAAGLLGLLAYEHAYVQAGQSVPLA